MIIRSTTKHTARLAGRTTHSLAREVDGLRAKVNELNTTLEQMEAEEGQEITDLKERLEASLQNEKNLMTRIKYLEARLVKAGEKSRVQRNLEAQLQGEVNELEGQVGALQGFERMFASAYGSLSRMKAQWQAEALEAMAEEIGRYDHSAGPLGISISVRMRAKGLRRQAEESTP